MWRSRAASTGMRPMKGRQKKEIEKMVVSTKRTSRSWRATVMPPTSRRMPELAGSMEAGDRGASTTLAST